MNRIACLFVTAFLLSGGAAFAQGELDAYRYSQSDLSGTARYLGMGGAFGALGGDISAMSSNPAGLGIYRSSEVVTTISLSSIKAKSNWNGSNADVTKNKFNFDNIAYVGYFPTGNDEGLIGWNVGFSYNRVKNFNRNYRVSGRQAYSLADYTAAKASYAGKDNEGWYGLNVGELNDLFQNPEQAYENLGGYWLPALGYQSGYYALNSGSADEYHSAFGHTENGAWLPYEPMDVQLSVNERGSIDKYDFSFAANISDRIFLGATVAVTDLNYRMSSTYDEFFGDKDNLWLDNQKSTDGTGYSFNIGAIVRPTDFLRLGVAYNSPTWYKMTDYFEAQGGTYIEGGMAEDEHGNLVPAPEMQGETPRNVYSDYKLRTSDKWIFSAAGIIGNVALISVDYELGNYKHMHLSDPNGYAFSDNELIKEDFGYSQAIKVGAEVKVTPQFAIRAGGGWQSSPMKKEFREGEFEVYPAGTVANYTLDKGIASFSVGLGYRFTPNFYMDLACVYREHKEDAYAFSKVIVDNQLIVDSQAATLKTNTTQVALTLGYKF